MDASTRREGGRKRSLPHAAQLDAEHATNPRLALLIAAALALDTASAAAQDLTFELAPSVSATIYGQINLTFQGVDDGEETYHNFVDNSNSTSRVGLNLDAPLGEAKLRFNFETGLGIRNTSEASQIDDVDWIDWRRTDIRKAEVSVSSALGKLWLGQGSMATDNAAEVDNSGTAVVGYVLLSDTAGSFQFRDGAALSGVTIGTVFKDFDGGRRLRVRYDTPEYAGFYLSGAYGQEILADGDDADYYDAALRYSLDHESVGVDAAAGYSWKEDEGVTTEALIASGTIIHKPSGVNLTLSGGDQNGATGKFLYAKLGWRGAIFSVGETAISADYYGGWDFLTSGADSEAWGLQAVQKFDALNLEAYVGFYNFSYDDDSGANFRDLNSLLVGGRWKF